MRSTVFFFMLLFTTMVEDAISQNLAPNPSFEEYNICPEDWNQSEPLQCIPWVQGNTGDADYYNVCGSPGDAGVPDNFIGNQWPVTGVAYVGVFTRNHEENYREYVQAPLTSPLEAGIAYQVSWYVSPADEVCSTQPFGALFTIGPPVINDQYVIEYTPQIEVNGAFLNDYTNWTLISRCFVAEGGEDYITLGNFRDDDDTPIDPECDITAVAYYYIDQVSVLAMPLSEEEFVLEPVTACGSYTINPGSAENYLWSDGTTNPTLTVTESGTYYVTLSDACAFSYGEIEVTIIPDSPPVVLPNDTLLCTGESVEIYLDPDAGIYEWQDQSNESEYTISQEGMYIVTLTDDCDMTSDTINVAFLDPPLSFSLGEDTLICDGDAFTISFDPSLGDFEWQDQSIDASYILDDDGTYSVTISNMCGEVSDEIEVGFIEQIVFSIGPDQMTLCDGNEFEIELDPSLGDFLWSDNSDGNTFTIIEAGLVSVTVSNVCYSVTHEMLVDVLYQPDFTLGPDITVCSGELPITLDLSDVEHAQSWEWTGGSTGSIYQITAPGTYSVTISNDCFAMSDEIVVSVGDVDPIVTLPVDQLLCEGQTYVLDAGGLMGNYQWQGFSSADTFLVTQAGTYSLTVTNICGSGADTVVIDYMQDLNPPDLGPDFSLCPGETGVLYANVDNVSYLWVDVSTGSTSDADSLIIAGPGMYALQISDACSSASDTIVITSNANPPDVNLPASIDLCEGDSIVIEAGVTGVQYLWNDASTGSATTEPEIIVTTSGIYYLQVSNACGTDADTIVINDAGPAPTVSLGADLSLCPGDVINVIPVSSDIQSWLWNDSSTASSFTVSSAGVVYVQGSNQCGQASDTINVTMLPATPPLDLGADLSICPGETITLTINEPNVDIVWHDGTTDAEYILANAGFVHATISNACGSVSDSVLVSLLDAAPSLDLGADQSLCPGESITFDPGISNVNYLWQDASTGSATTSPTLIVDTPATIILTISNDCGSATDTVLIIEDTNGPQLDLGPDILACEGDVVILEAAISGVNYLWQDGTVASQHVAMLSGIYHLTVSNACGSDTDTVIVDIHGTIPVPSLGADTSLCEGEVLELISDADIETSIVWQDGSALSEFIVSLPGHYSLTATNHCGSASDTIIVSYEAGPEPFDLGEDVILCLGDSVVLVAPSGTALITWQDGSHGTSFIADQEQVYSLQISNDCGLSSDDVFVSFDQDVPVVDLEPSLSICPDQSVTLDVTQIFDASYLWNTGSTLPSIVITQPDLYAVTVSTECYSISDDILIETNNCVDHEIFIPNIFSPNGDNVNDHWEVHITDPNVMRFECRIFDRWGNLLFETNEMPVAWDGRFEEKELNPGVYVYVIIVEKEDGTSDGLSGDITLVR